MEQLFVEWDNFDILGIHLETIDHVNHLLTTNHELHNDVVSRADFYLKEIIEKMKEMDEQAILFAFGDHGT